MTTQAHGIITPDASSDGSDRARWDRETLAPALAKTAERPVPFTTISGRPVERVYSAEDLASFDLSGYGAPIEANTDLFPNRTNVSFWRRDSEDEITARIYERGVGETLSSGTGASGAAVAFVLRGGDSPVTVHLDGGDLEVEVGEDLHVNLTGWAVPVYSGALSPDFVKELSDETQ